MYLDNHVTVIIPALNEQSSIGRVISDIPKFVDQIIVVDNGSCDQTAEIARSLGTRVVVESRRGYGAACQAGLSEVGDTDLVGFIDGDYSDYPAQLVRVIAPVATGKADLAIGCRHHDNQLGQTGLYWHQRWGNWLVCQFVGLAYGHKITDFGPMRCVRWSCLKPMNMCDPDYGWTAEMQIKAIKYGFEIVEVPVSYRPRIGESKISGTIKGSILAGYKIISWAVRLLFSNTKPILKSSELKTFSRVRG